MSSVLVRSLVAGLACLAASVSLAEPPASTLPALMSVVDLDVGETTDVTLLDGRKVTVKLLDLAETRDELRDAVRRAEVTVHVGGQMVKLVSANYRLPQTVGSVQIDCPITQGYCRSNSKNVNDKNPWGLVKAVRLRLWPADSPWIQPGAFLYPAQQRWFASGTQMANEPTHVDGGENPKNRNIYYHYGLDIGGPEGLVNVIAATDGIVVSKGTDVLPGYKDSPVKPRYDVVYLLDERGWYYRYSHLESIADTVRLGQPIRMGQPVGVLGKEGGSGGWSHLHFDISSRQPSGEWGIIDGYAFLWEAYRKQYQPQLLAVARPHQLVTTGQTVTLDGTRSWAADGIAKSEWTFTDGTTATGSQVERRYARPGVYSEILKITDRSGRVEYDFAVVNVLDKSKPDDLPPSIHAAYAPSFGIKPGDPVTFKCRTFRTTDGVERWNFGDGSPPVEVRSDGNVKTLAKDGYAITEHRFTKPGQYIVRVERTNNRGETAIGYVHVRVGQD